MTEEDRIAISKNKIGLLDPDGTLHECESWEHLDTAYEIVEQMADAPAKARMNRLEAESYLQNLGWVIVRARDVYGMIGYLGENDKVIHLSEEQKKWLTDNYEFFPTDKQASVDDLLDNRDRWEL